MLVVGVCGGVLIFSLGVVLGGWVPVGVGVGRGEHAVGFTLSTVRATGWWCVVVGGLTGVPGCSGCGGVGGLFVNCIVVVSIFLFCGFV